MKLNDKLQVHYTNEKDLISTQKINAWWMETFVCRHAFLATEMPRKDAVADNMKYEEITRWNRHRALRVTCMRRAHKSRKWNPSPFSPPTLRSRTVFRKDPFFFRDTSFSPVIPAGRNRWSRKVGVLDKFSHVGFWKSSPAVWRPKKRRERKRERERKKEERGMIGRIMSRERSCQDAQPLEIIGLNWNPERGRS